MAETLQHDTYIQIVKYIDLRQITLEVVMYIGEYVSKMSQTKFGSNTF